jgi:hypothetical protein
VPPTGTVRPPAGAFKLVRYPTPAAPVQLSQQTAHLPAALLALQLDAGKAIGIRQEGPTALAEARVSTESPLVGGGPRGGEPERSGRLPVGTLAVSINNSVPILTNDHSISFRHRTRRSR